MITASEAVEMAKTGTTDISQEEAVARAERVIKGAAKAGHTVTHFPVKAFCNQSDFVVRKLEESGFNVVVDGSWLMISWGEVE